MILSLFKQRATLTVNEATRNWFASEKKGRHEMTSDLPIKIDVFIDYT